MIVRKSYVSDINGTVYTTGDIPVPVQGNLSLEGLTSPVTYTYNGSATQPTLPGYYDVVATLNDPVYSASATGRLLITTATAATVTLNIPAAPSASTPVTATSNQPSLAPVVTYDGSTTFPATPGFYAVKAVVADGTYFGSKVSLVSIGRPSATLSWGNLNFAFNGLAQRPAVTTIPAGLPTQVSLFADGILPGLYQVTASITDPGVNFTPLVGTMVIAADVNSGGHSSLVDWMFGANGPASGLAYARRTGAQIRAILPDPALYPDTASYPVFSLRVRSNRQGVLITPQACDNLVFGPAGNQRALFVETSVLDAAFELQTYVVVPVAGGPASPRAFLRFLLDYSALTQ